MQVLFALFAFGFIGWLLESLQESIVRKRIVNKGFFRGPFVLSQAIGGVAVYLVGASFRAHPAAVFFIGMAGCTLVEYLAALFLEKVFQVRCWDYRTYPHTRFAHFRGRICLTISLFFGAASLAVVYVFWDMITVVTSALGPRLFWINAALVLLFAFDAIYSITKVIKARISGQALTGWALFTLKEQ
ncbi:hypothetical protein FACS1894147_09460 [Spirochaetia bacterium]|nr:hypothetical protein FACS1894147_09460 [Spirochaetia bacterium]